MVTNYGFTDWSDLRTPAYVYDVELLNTTIKKAKQEANKHGYHIHYAFKANTEATIIDTMREAHFGADCVSGNEVEFALNSGFNPESIVFAGVGKTDEEIRYALEQNIFCFNCESIEEIEVINEIATEMGKIARIALRLNPNIRAGGHEYITTGTVENKFGIQQHDLDYFLENFYLWNHIKCIGIHFHIGSQITENEPFAQLAQTANQMVEYIEEKGIPINYINLGGGLGINYEAPNEDAVPDFEAYFQAIAEHLNDTGRSIHFELGRSLVGQCGNLLTKVLYTKKGEEKNFLIVDAGMTELLRPALYQAKHQISNISSEASETQHYDVVGPVCESSDCFDKENELPISRRGDLLLIKSAGAYAQSMSLNYNLRKAATSYFDTKGMIRQLNTQNKPKETTALV